MPLAAGDRIGCYGILSLLGKGGMGEVYRARDPKLHRDVAIKVLPPALANDADYRARFEREAQALAALNHPNIAAIYGLEENAIVMELVEGETLRGPLSVAEAVPIARQIAEALEAAHEKGIIHRDLKPGNIKITPDGVVKVLDFGLAKATGSSAVASGADSPTLTLRATEAGLILGTAAYMSPEQATGKHVDRRADIWSYGVVLFELLTGKPLFGGETVSDTLADVLRAPIDFGQLPNDTPPALRELLRRCLDRSLKHRLRDIGEARIAIEDCLANPNAPAASSPTRRNWWPMALSGALVLAVLLGLAGWRWNVPVVKSPATFELNPPQGIRFGLIGIAGGSAISPNGQMLAFVGKPATGEVLLFVRSLDSLEARALPGTEGAGRPFWSPDSKSLGFFSAGKLKRVDLTGGRPFVLCNVEAARGGSWSGDGEILFANRNVGLQRIRASGGTPANVTTASLGSGGEFHYYPQFLPGGRQFIYLLRRPESEESEIVVGSLDGRPPVALMRTRYNAMYDPATRRLLYIQGEGTLMARPMELDPPRLTGDAVILAEGVATANLNSYAHFSISGEGTLFYGREVAYPPVLFQWRDRTGKVLASPGTASQSGNTFSLSPDDGKVAFSVNNGGESDIYVMDLARGLSTRLTFSAQAMWPKWAADGHIYFWSKSKKGFSKKAANGSGEEELVWRRDDARILFLLDVSRDGRFLLCAADSMLMIPLREGAKPTEYVNKELRVGSASFSPDGRWVAYASQQSGRAEVFVESFPDHGRRMQMSSKGGIAPVWRADGKELYWSEPDGTVVAGPLEFKGQDVVPGRTENLFAAPGSYAAPSRDGKRFLVQVPDPAHTGLPMVVVQNWPAKLER